MKTIPLRKDVNTQDKWDLTSLYKTENDWEVDLKKMHKSITRNVYLSHDIYEELALDRLISKEYKKKYGITPKKET